MMYAVNMAYFLRGGNVSWTVCKIRFFKFYEKSTGGILPIFCMKLQQNKSLKLTQMVFREENCFLVFRKFFLYEKLTLRFFVVFA